MFGAASFGTLLSKALVAGVLLVCALIGLGRGGLAQAGALDPTFNVLDNGSFGSGSGFSGTVRAVALQPDGRAIVGGAFTNIHGTARNRIARLQADGSLDESFQPGTGANGTVYAVAIQPDGKVLVGGNFSSFNGVARNRMVRLLADGSVDAGFNNGAGGNFEVFALALQPDGKVLIGGAFTSFHGVTRNRIARLNVDGSLDLGFDPGTGANLEVYSLSLQADGRVWIGGAFTSCNGSVCNRIARLNADGSLDGGFSAAVGANGTVWALNAQPDGRVLLGGDFTSYDGVSRSRIARSLANGALDASFDPGIGVNHTIWSMELQPDGKLLIGGLFFDYNGFFRGRIARVLPDGSLDASFNAGTGPIADVHALDLQSDGRILVGGAFTSYNGVARSRLARAGADGALDASFFSVMSFNAPVRALALQPDGKHVVGGEFTHFQGVTRYRIARLLSDGSLDSGFDAGSGPDNAVASIQVQPDGKLLIGGPFLTIGGIPRKGIARLNPDGSLDASFNPGSGADQQVIALALQPDGRIVVGGSFATFNGVSRNGIVRLMSDGSIDATFNPGTGTLGFAVLALALQSDGRILLGGNFPWINGVTCNRLGRLNADGSLDAGFNTTVGASSSVYAITVQPDGRILIGGIFANYDGTPRSNVARVLANGSLDASFDPGAGLNNTPRGMALQPDGKLLMAGEFTTANGIVRNRIARLNPDGSHDLSFDPGAGANGLIYALALQPDGKAVIGGAQTSYGSAFRHRIARVLAYDPFVEFCFGDGSAGTACPCVNIGLGDRGCNNSLSTGGGQLGGSGNPAADAVVLSASGLLPTALTIFLQGTTSLSAPAVFGDGVRCVGGALKRLYVKSASAGSVSAPAAGDPSIRAQSAALGDVIAPGTKRYYQAYYRDANASFCPAPAGSTYNITNGVEILWP